MAGEEGQKEAKGGELPKTVAKAELTPEDAELQAALSLMVQRSGDPDQGVQRLALESLRREIRSATSSMTSVPKPLKFLRPKYDTLKATFETCAEGENKRLFADIISLLAMTRPAEKDAMPESLRYRLLGSAEDIGSFGHEYVRNLAGEISHEFARRCEAAGEPANIDDLLPLVHQILPFHMRHNAEPEAVDLLLELERLDLLPAVCDEANHGRAALYLVSCAAYLAEPEDEAALRCAHSIYIKFHRLPEALRCALKLAAAGEALVGATLSAAEDASLRTQLCHMLARGGVLPPALAAEGALGGGAEEEALRGVLGNARLSEHFLALGRDLDVVEAKTPEDLYKSHLVEGRAPAGAAAVDSARANLAATFVNAFVNAGFGHDKLLTGAEAGTSSNVSWIYKNKEHGKLAAAASLGLIMLWDVEGGLPQIDKYLYASDPQVVAGALLAVGLVNCGVRSEMDPAYALLYESVGKEAKEVRCAAMLGLGLAYAGAARRDVAELLIPVVADESGGMEVAGSAALALGLVFVGSCDGEAAESLLTCLMTRSETDLSQPFAQLLCLALGLLFLGRGAAAEATAEVVKTLHPRVARFAAATLDGCAYAGTGNVLKVQQLLAVAGEKVAPPEPEAPAEGAAPAAAADADEPPPAWCTAHQSAAVLGVALVALGEEVGSEMAVRALERILQYGDAAQRKAVPLAMALLSASRPALGVTEALGRLAHDPHEETALSALLGLGLTACGTNNARVAGQLRQLSSYYHKDAGLLFMVRCAQGLVHAGKGLLSASPLHSDRQLLSLPALAGLACVCWAALESKETLLGRHASLLYLLAPALQPHSLHTVDESGAPLPVPVRVGEAVDTVAQAGRPKTITGFQTHTTPVLLAVGERAELGTEQYIALSPVLEGVVILRKNAAYLAPV